EWVEVCLINADLLEAGQENGPSNRLGGHSAVVCIGIAPRRKERLSEPLANPLALTRQCGTRSVSRDECGPDGPQHALSGRVFSQLAVEQIQPVSDGIQRLPKVRRPRQTLEGPRRGDVFGQRPGQRHTGRQFYQAIPEIRIVPPEDQWVKAALRGAERRLPCLQVVSENGRQDQ